MIMWFLISALLSLIKWYLAGKKEGADCGIELSVSGYQMNHGNCEEGLVCVGPKQDLNLKEPYILPGKCKRSGKNRTIHMTKCSLRKPELISKWYLSGKKQGEYCGTSSSIFGEDMNHGTCEKGLICDEPTHDGGFLPPSPGICRRSGEKK